MVILPELVLTVGALALFCISLGKTPTEKAAQTVATCFGLATLLGCLLSFKAQGSLFYGAYSVDQYSQLFKLMIAGGLTMFLLFTPTFKAIDRAVRPEYFMFLLLSVLGLMMLVSSVELMAIFIHWMVVIIEKKVFNNM